MIIYPHRAENFTIPILWKQEKPQENHIQRLPYPSIYLIPNRYQNFILTQIGR